MQAAIYTRQSRKKDKSASHAVQEKLCREFCEQQGWEVAGVFSDSDSGYKRDNLLRRDQLTEPNGYGVVVVYKGDRISRHTDDLRLLYDKLPPVVAIDGSLDTRGMSAAQRKAARDALSQNQWFSEQLSERIRDVQDANLAEGKWQGGTPPWGYQLTDELHLTADPESSARRAAELLIKQQDTRQVADTLNEEGYRRPRGQVWFPAEVRRYLNYQHLAGHVEWRGERILVEEPVLDAATDAEVKAILTRSAKPHVTARTDYWLTGLINCPCGGRLHGKGKRGRRNQPQYGCSRNRPGEATACSYTYRRYWDAREIEETAWGELVSWLEAAEQGEANFPWFPSEETDNTEDVEQVDQLRNRVAGLDEAITKASADLYDPDGHADEDTLLELKQRRSGLVSQLFELEQSLHEQRRQIEAATFRAELESTRLKQIAEPDERRQILLTAGLRLALWEDGPQTWDGGPEIWWRWQTV